VFNIGPQELLLILLVALVIVGPQRLPELSRTIGRGLREFRKAQEEVKKTIRLGLDDTEPTASGRARTGRGTEAAPAGDPAAPSTVPGPDEGAPAPPPDDAADVARSLGRGLAEIRRARREIERTFRVDLSDRPSPGGRPRPVPASPTAPAPEPEPGATEPGSQD